MILIPGNPARVCSTASSSKLLNENTDRSRDEDNVTLVIQHGCDLHGGDRRACARREVRSHIVKGLAGASYGVVLGDNGNACSLSALDGWDASVDVLWVVDDDVDMLCDEGVHVVRTLVTSRLELRMISVTPRFLASACADFQTRAWPVFPVSPTRKPILIVDCEPAEEEGVEVDPHPARIAGTAARAISELHEIDLRYVCISMAPLFIDLLPFDSELVTRDGGRVRSVAGPQEMSSRASCCVVPGHAIPPILVGNSPAKYPPIGVSKFHVPRTVFEFNSVRQLLPSSLSAASQLYRAARLQPQLPPSGQVGSKTRCP